MRNGRIVVLIVVGIGLALVAGVFWVSYAPTPSLKISPSTTVVLGPLDEEGYIDYAAAMRQLQQKDVVPGSNAAVPLLQATWPDEPDETEHQLLAEVLDDLEDPQRQQYVLSRKYVEQVEQWLRRTHINDNGEVPECIPSYTFLEARRSPWKAEECPPLGLWVLEQHDALEQLHAARLLPHFYCPDPKLLKEDVPLRFASDFASRQLFASAVALSIRAMLWVGEEQFERAWDDIEVVYWLSSRGNCQTMDDLQKRFAIRQIALHSTLVLVTSCGCDQEVLKKIDLHLRTLPSMREIVRDAVTFQHFAALDTVQRLMQESVSRDDYLLLRIRETRLLEFPFDVNAAMKRINGWFERLERFLGEDRFSIDEAVAFAQSIPELDTLDLDSNYRRSDFEGRGARVGDTIAALWELDDWLLWAPIMDELDTQRDLLRVALTLEQFRCEAGSYPKTLTRIADRAPNLLDDPYSGQLLRYERRGEGFLLYSVGADEVDSGGQGGHLETGIIKDGDWATGHFAAWVIDGKDLVVRVPIPRFQPCREIVKNPEAEEGGMMFLLEKAGLLPNR